MNPLLIIGALVAGGAVMLIAAGGGKSNVSRSGHRAIKGLPNTKRVRHTIAPGYASPFTGAGVKAEVYYGFNWYDISDINQPNRIEKLEIWSGEIGRVFAERRKALPADASPGWVDKYSKGYYVLPIWIGSTDLGGNVPNDSLLNMTPVLFDEFGRLKPGHYGQSQNLWDMTFGNLLANPLFAATLGVALVAFGGPVGLAAYGALAVYQNRGAELSLKNVAIAAAKAAVVSQCGPACGTAFDFGVGVMSGDSVDVAAEKALLGELTPEQREVYLQGKQLAKDVL
jgi:hypothetical protein